MNKIIAYTLFVLFLISAGCTKHPTQNKTATQSGTNMNKSTEPTEVNNEKKSSEQAKKDSRKKDIFRLRYSSFSVLLSDDWSFPEQGASTAYSYMNIKEDLGLVFIEVSKNELNQPAFLKGKNIPKADIPEYMLNDMVRSYESQIENFKELSPPLTYDIKNKKIKSLIYTGDLERTACVHVFSLIEFKKSDIFLVAYQSCRSENWDSQKENLKEIIYSVEMLD